MGALLGALVQLQQPLPELPGTCPIGPPLSSPDKPAGSAESNHVQNQRDSDYGSVIIRVAVSLQVS